MAKTPAPNEAVCRKWRCISPDSLWDFGSFVTRPSLCGTAATCAKPPVRCTQAARAWWTMEWKIEN
jgi:hypothetical protein